MNDMEGKGREYEGEVQVKNFNLNKREFGGAIKAGYAWEITVIPTIYV